MRIAVIGAYGYTGKLICERLSENQVDFSIYGRDAKKLEELKNEYSSIIKFQPIDVRNVHQAEAVVKDNDILINCAGPFTEEATQLLKEAVNNGKIYLDITGELSFVKQSYETHNAIAIQNEAKIIHGCAFESAVVDLALAIIRSTTPINEFRSIYFFNQHKVSPGTRMTMKLSKYRPNWSVQKSHWELTNVEKNKINSPHTRWNKSVGIPYPLPETAFAKWNFDVNESSSLLAVEKTEALFIQSKEVEQGDALETLDKIRARKKDGPNAKEMALQESEIFIQINYKSDFPDEYLISCTNMYKLTADIIVLALKALLNNPSSKKGVFSPSHLFKNPEQTLHDLGVEIRKFVR